MQKRKIILFFSLIILAAVVVFLNSNLWMAHHEVEAESDDNVEGWAWSENIGWVSLNCRNQELLDPRCSDTNYGVHIEDSGNFIGYAWSESIGWIDFDPAGPYPQNPQESVRVNTSNGVITGWARALNYGGGWDGWISMAGTSPDYGVSIDTGTGDFGGWAWGGDVVGWLHFAYASGLTDYKAETSFSFNNNPVVSNLSVDQGDYCVLAFHPKFYWDFDDVDAGDFQNSYQVQIDDDADIGASPLIDSCFPAPGTCDDGYTISEYPSANPSAFRDKYSTTFYWRIKAWDNRGGVSEWVESQFTTILHQVPDVDFTWTPLRPSRDEFTQFCATMEVGVCTSDVAKCYNALGVQISCSGNTFAWTFPPGTEFSTTTSAASENPKIKFPATGWQVVTLRINDGVGNCSATKNIRVSAPLPKWREIAP